MADSTAVNPRPAIWAWGTAGLAVLSAVLLPSAAVAAYCGVEIEPRYRPVPPGTPAAVAALHGPWGNEDTRWGGSGSCTRIFVESVSADGPFMVLYVWGDSPDGTIKRGSYRARDAQLTGAKLWFRFPWQTVVEYSLNGDRLDATYRGPGSFVSNIVMPRPADYIPPAR